MLCFCKAELLCDVEKTGRVVMGTSIVESKEMKDNNMIRKVSSVHGSS